MSYLDWHVGMKVVYVGGGSVLLTRSGWRRFVPGFKRTPLTHNLIIGEVYTIERLVTHTNVVDVQPVVCIHVAGQRYREHSGVAFPAKFFRPIQPRKTDISVFTAMLHDVKRSEPVMLSTPWGRVPA